MKYLIASDIHGSAPATRLLLERMEEERADRLVLLGDLLAHGPRNGLPHGYAPMEVAELLNSHKDAIVAVRGNCDAEVDQMVLEFPCMADYAVLEAVSGISFFLTHGHLWSPESLPPLAKESVFVSGHTHIKELERRNGAVILNPGSISLPKDGSASFALACEDMLSLRSLDGQVTKELSLDFLLS